MVVSNWVNESELLFLYILGAASIRHSSHGTMDNEEFDARYEAYFNKPDVDGWEIRKAMNDLHVSIYFSHSYCIPYGFDWLM